ncbi:hypothetical protein KC19_5G019700 [Ceratodon purpureus]|uniref:Non-specific serine/threonine protein kinase n=1 Tax=Ceratodon purpureus TaxID=3225 RepID=A0A8T0HWZ0_CERPU|nr:hypothetical protein KC19_5G019700 [Ceratodon purpureus]
MYQLVITLVLLQSMIQRGEALSVMVSGPSYSSRMKMQANRYLNASAGDVYLVMQPDCVLYIYKGATIISRSNMTLVSQRLPWTPTNVSESSDWNCYLDNQADGNFVVYTWNGTLGPQPTAVWAANTASNGGTNSTYRFALLGSDGKLTMYGPDFAKLTMPTPLQDYNSTGSLNISQGETPNMVYPFPTRAAWKPDVSLDGFPYMPVGYFINQGSWLQSADRFRLVLQPDCNLKLQEIWPENNTVKQVIWEPPTTSGVRTSCQLVLQPTGVLEIKSNGSEGTVYWSSGTAGDPTVNWVLKLNSDRGGHLVVADILNSGTQLWTTLADSSSSNQMWWWIVVGVVGGVLALVAVALLFWFCYARDKFLDPIDKAFQKKMQTSGFSQVWYSDSKIKQCTDNFAHKIGQGGFGDVFYGKLPDGQEIAAKVLTPESCQSKQEFYNEIELLSTVHHKYLVSLLGYRCTRRHQILIYEYLGGGDLRQRLQGTDARKNPLNWSQRTSIILQVAEGLEYLHDKCSPSIIHRDVKSNNILLTNKNVAKLADFGLSKIRELDQEDATHITTIVKGTPGYLDPEYHETGMLTSKSDVYAFGIVIMEILTGRNQMGIAQRVEDAWKSESLNMLPDPLLDGDLDIDEFIKLVELALWCARKRNEERPFMRQVVHNLRESISLASLETSKPEIDFLNEPSYRDQVMFDITSDSMPFSKTSSFNPSTSSSFMALEVQQPSIPTRRSIHHMDIGR